MATGDLQGHYTFAIEGDPQGNALCRNITTVTMPTRDVLRHFGKMMLYIVSIRIAYSYLYILLVVSTIGLA